MRVVLASGSPRRRELMEMLGVACEVQASGAEEVGAFTVEVSGCGGGHRR